MNKVIAVAVLAGAFLAAACTTTDTIEGQKIRASAQTVVETVEVTGGLHDKAPQWFKDYWREYMQRAAGGYATMAMDRQLRGVQYVYCPTAPCRQMRHDPRARTFLQVEYKHGALKGCRAVVRENFPAAKPRCAIYAINEKIVWKGPLPWK